MDPIQTPSGQLIQEPWQGNPDQLRDFFTLVALSTVSKLWVKMFPSEDPPHLVEFDRACFIYIQRWGW